MAVVKWCFSCGRMHSDAATCTAITKASGPPPPPPPPTPPDKTYDMADSLAGPNDEEDALVRAYDERVRDVVRCEARQRLRDAALARLEYALALLRRAERRR